MTGGRNLPTPAPRRNLAAGTAPKAPNPRLQSSGEAVQLARRTATIRSPRYTVATVQEAIHPIRRVSASTIDAMILDSQSPTRESTCARYASRSARRSEVVGSQMTERKAESTVPPGKGQPPTYAPEDKEPSSFPCAAETTAREPTGPSPDYPISASRTPLPRRNAARAPCTCLRNSG